MNPVERCPNHARGINIPATRLIFTAKYCDDCYRFLLRPVYPRLTKAAKCIDCPFARDRAGLRCSYCARRHSENEKRRQASAGLRKGWTV